MTNYLFKDAITQFSQPVLFNAELDVLLFDPETACQITITLGADRVTFAASAGSLAGGAGDDLAYGNQGANDAPCRQASGGMSP